MRSAPTVSLPTGLRNLNSHDIILSVMNPIRIDPEIMHGAPCFAGTRVPIQNFFDDLQGGHSVEEFLIDFPTVTHEQVNALIELAKSRLLPDAA